MNVSTRMTLIATYEWAPSCGGGHSIDELEKISKQFRYGSTSFVLQRGLEPGTVQRTNGYYGHWTLNSSNFQDEKKYLDRIGATRDDYALLPITVTCDVAEQKAGIQAHMSEGKPDRYLVSEDGACFVSFKFDPADPYAIRGGEVRVLSHKEGKLTADDPKALACIVRGLAMHKGAMGAWDIPDAELLGPHPEEIVVAMGNRVEIASVGYDVLMYAPFGPGMSREAALRALPEVRNPLSCTLQPGAEAAYGRPFFQDYKRREC